MLNRILVLSLLLLAICLPDSLAQTTAPEVEKTKQAAEKKALDLVDQILAEAQSLKLPENRLRIKAMAAGMLWEKDQTRARTYFREAENDLKQLILALGQEQENRQRKIDQFTQFRSELLRNLSQLDPQLALELMNNTKLPAEYKRQFGGGYDPDLQLEAELASRAALGDPAKAIKMADELLQKGYANQILNLVDNLRGSPQGRSAATEIYQKLIGKLGSEDFLSNNEAVHIADRILNQANNEWRIRNAAIQTPNQAANARPPQTVIDDQMFRELIEVVAKAALKTSAEGNRTNNANRLKAALQSIQPAVEKVAPTQLSALKIRPAANASSMTNAPNQQAFAEFRVLSTNPATTQDQLVEFVKRASPQEQPFLYQQIAMRSLSKGETEQAKQIIETYVKDPAIKGNFEQMRTAMAMSSAMQKGNLEEARQQINAVTSPKRKAELLIALARQLTPKDKASATSYLDEAAALLGTDIETVQTINSLNGLIQAYASVTPERSFELMEPMLIKFNAVITAMSIVDSFEGRNGFEHGEAKVGTGGSMYWLANFTNNLMSLAAIDFDRAKTTAERFERLEMRLNALVAVAAGVLRPNRPQRFGGGMPPPPPVPFIR